LKKVVALIVVAGAVYAMIAARKQQSAGPKPTIWEKMQEGMEAMPEDFPPRVMFDNVAAARENTDRILEMLSESSSSVEPEAARG
jgi:hypothetical protein